MSIPLIRHAALIACNQQNDLKFSIFGNNQKCAHDDNVGSLVETKMIMIYF